MSPADDSFISGGLDNSVKIYLIGQLNTLEEGIGITGTIQVTGPITVFRRNLNNGKIYSRLSRRYTARGSCTGLVTLGPTKV